MRARVGSADARFDALVRAELSDDFALGPMVARDDEARTILVRLPGGADGLFALHVFARTLFPEREQDLDLERTHERWMALRHPHLARLVRAGATPRLQWCIVPATVGGSLLVRLAAEGAMPIDAAIRIAAQLADALQAAHDVGLAHGRLTAAHVMLDAADGAVLTGFGFAGGVRTRALVEDAGPAADQAALAYLVYQCVTGDVDSGSDEASVDYWRVPVAIRPVLQQARSIRRSSRYRDMFAFIAALRSAHDALLPRAVAAGDRREVAATGPVMLLLVEPPRPVRRVMPAVVLLALALAIVAALPAVPTPQSRVPRAPRALESRGIAIEPVAAHSPPLRTPMRSSTGVAPHTVRRAPLARAVDQAPTVAPFRAPLLERTRLAEREPTLTISSRPWGVVSVDGQYLGNTPVLGAPLSAGPHRLRIERAGFAPYEVTVFARRGEDLRLVDIALAALPR